MAGLRRQVGGQEVDAALLEDRHRGRQLRADQHGQDCQREEQSEQQGTGEDEAGDVDAVASDRAVGGADRDRGESIRPGLVLLPDAAHEAVADDVQRQGHHEKEEADEEQALEGGVAPATWSLPAASEAIAPVIVWPGRVG